MPDQKTSSRIDPMSSRDSDWFWEAAAESQLKIQQCQGCQRRWHPPRPVCPECHSTEQVPTAVSGRGTIYSFVCVRHPPPFGFEQPPLIALVELEEEGNIRLITNIIDAELEDLDLGMPVEVDFEKTMSGKSVPVFRLADKKEG